MQLQINMIGIITSRIEVMKAFYRDVLGMEIGIEMDEFVEFKHEGVRFALSTNAVMEKATGDPGYSAPKSGHSLELAFKVESEAAVDSTYSALIEKGATPVKEPETMPWNQRTAFFADPDGHIHEIFTDL